MKINDAVFGAVLLLLGVAVLLAIRGYSHMPGQNVGPALFPGLIATGLVVCAVLLIVGGVRRRADTPWFEPMPWLGSRRHIIAFLTVIGSVVIYIALVDRVGFLIIAPLTLFAMFLAFGVRRTTAAIVAVLASIAIWYAFYKLLRVPLAWGLLERFAF